MNSYEKNTFIQERLQKEAKLLNGINGEEVLRLIKVFSDEGRVDFGKVSISAVLGRINELMTVDSLTERDTALFLLLFERALSLVQLIDQGRIRIAEELTALINIGEELGVGEEKDKIYLAELRRKLEILNNGSYESVLTVMEAEDHAVLKASSQIQGGLENLDESLEGMIQQIRARIRQSDSPEKKDLELIYLYIENEEDLAFARSIEPLTFIFTEGGATPEQRRWIYALFLYGLKDEKHRIELRKFLAEKIFKVSVSQIAAVTAYLSGLLFETALAKVRNQERGGGQVAEAIRFVLTKNGTVKTMSEALGDSGHILVPLANDRGSLTEEILTSPQLGVELFADANGDSSFNPNNADLTVIIPDPIDNDVKIEITREAARNPNYDNSLKDIGWRNPGVEMVRNMWKGDRPLKGRRILMFGDPQLLEWQQWERLGADESLVTFIERDRFTVEDMRVRLPRAAAAGNILHTDLEKYVLGLAKERMIEANTLEAWIDLGLNPKNPGHFHSIPNTGANAPLGLRDSNIMIPVSLPTSPALRPALPEDPTKVYDLISLDSKSQFATLSPTLLLLFNLGLMPESGLFFTNFVAQRESSDSSYSNALLVREKAGLTGSQKVDLNSELRERRSEGISSLLRTFIATGSSTLDELDPNNPFSQHYKMMRHQLERGIYFEDLILAISNLIDISGRMFSHSINPSIGSIVQVIKNWGIEEWEKLEANNIFKKILLDRVRGRIIEEKFRHFAHLMTPDLARTRSIFPYAQRTQQLPIQVLCDLTSQMMMAHFGKPYIVLDHKAWEYGDGTLMHSDFMRIQTIRASAQLHPPVMDEIRKIYLTDQDKVSLHANLPKKALLNLDRFTREGPERLSSTEFPERKRAKDEVKKQD